MYAEESAEAWQGCCAGCNRSKGGDGVVGGILNLPGDWVANHYGGSEGFLGWLALQPKYHRMELGELTPHELGALGPNLQLLDRLLRRYWEEHYPLDPVKRAYFVYFFESALNEPPTDFHLHLHLIPRTDRIGSVIREYPERQTAPRCPHLINAWSIASATARADFPNEYRKSAASEERIMNWLRAQLPSPP